MGRMQNPGTLEQESWALEQDFGVWVRICWFSLLRIVVEVRRLWRDIAQGYSDIEDR